MEVLIRYSAVALLLAGSACDFVRPPTVVDIPRDQLLVHSVLSAGTDTVRVLLTRPASAQSFDRAPAPIPVSGARVRIAGGGAEVLLREAAEGFAACLTPRYNGDPSPPPTVAGLGCYTAILPGGVQADARYTLEVDTPGGERARGETTVPATPGWIYPREAERISMRWNLQMGYPVAEAESVVLRWRSSAAAVEIPISVSYEVYAGRQAADAHSCALYLTNPDGSFVAYGTGLVQGDSIRVRAHLTNCTRRGDPPGSTPLRPDSAAFSLLLAAYDSAYMVHADRRDGRGLREDRASPGLTGAYGVFGSVATAGRRVMFVIEGS
ncbi:MAG: DUF4249 family protein [Gemmatimonadetes bacterium]|nr:DUF4249 family protein [Gemmatimonadota bacterium]